MDGGWREEREQESERRWFELRKGAEERETSYSFGVGQEKRGAKREGSRARWGTRLSFPPFRSLV